MGDEAFGTRDEIRLPFEPGDRFIQVHANGAILVVADDYQWNLTTAGQAVAVALESVEQGTRILVGHEVLDDRTVDVLEAVRSTGAEIVEFGTVVPPMTWPDGTTPLMTAATLGRADLVADLIDRGVSIQETDDTGATALHHAAHAGDATAVDLLVAAGADRALVDGRGRTAADLARIGGHSSLAGRIAVDRGDVRFGGAWARWAYQVFGVVGIVVVVAISLPSLELPWSVLAVAMAVGTAWVFRHLLSAGAPLELRSDGVLRVLTWHGVVRVPLDAVRGVIAIPAHGVQGAAWRVVLCQDLVGMRSTPGRLRGIEHRFIGEDDAERFAAIAERHLVLVLGRARGVDRVLAALRGPLSRPDAVGNEVWHLLERHSSAELYQR